MKLSGWLFATLVLCGGALQAGVLIDNGVTGDGRWQVEVNDGGETRRAEIDPTGSAGLTDVVFDYFNYVDIGINGNAKRLSGFTTTPAYLSGPNQVTSSGVFAGQNGNVFWESVSSIAPGSPILATTITFSSANPFGDIRFIQYLDEDVYGYSNDVLVQFGTPGASNFELLTVDGTDNVGVAQFADYSPTNMFYVGWAARPFSALRSAIQGPGQSFSIPGVVQGLSPYNDPRYPGQPAWGKADITSALAFDLDPTAFNASVTFFLGGSPSGSSVSSVPEPTSLFVLSGLIICGVGCLRRRRLAAERE